MGRGFSSKIEYIRRVKTTIFTLAAVLFAACGGAPKTPDGDVFVVTIEPLKWLIDNIIGDDFEVTVLVPPGASPETFEPTPVQVRAAENARFVFATGLVEFERELVDRLPHSERIVDLSVGVQLIDSEHVHEHNEHYAGADPHIWMSPRALLKMASTAYEKIHAAYPDSASYTASYARLKERLTALDCRIATEIRDAKTPKSFLIFHPGLTYFARDYGLTQIALEVDGKDLTVRQLRETIELARAEKIDKIFYQREFPQSLVEVTARELGARVVEIDILGYDVEGNLLNVSDLITAVDQ